MNRMPDRKYEELYTELLGRGEQLHNSNKRRIRRGIAFLIILPAALEFIRWITDSDKVVFLIIWILIMFAVSAYLISIEYLDSAIEETLRDVTDTEASFDDLLPRPELRYTDLHERIRERLAGRFAAEEEELEEEAEMLEGELDKAIKNHEKTEESPAAAPESDGIAAATETIMEFREAEEALEELRETAPAEIITAMKEAFDADMKRKEDAE